MHVVAARVHHADFLAAVLGANRGGEGISGVLGHGERVHVRPNRDHVAGQAPLQDPDDSGVRDPLDDFVEAQFT